MTNYAQRIKMLMLIVVTSLSAVAHDFEVNGVYYNILSIEDRTVEVTFYGDDGTHHNNVYFGEIDIPSTVFYGESVYSVIQIGELAFFEDQITAVRLPNSIISIGGSAFNSSSLSEITIPSSVIKIEGGAFEGCHNLTDIYIPESVIFIGTAPFCRCSKLMNISVSSENEKFCSIDGVLYNKELTKLYQFPSGRVACNIPNSVIEISDYAFAWSGLQEVSIPNSVTYIGCNAFFLCDITSVILPDSVATIGSDAFWGCNITEVCIPKSVTTIGTTPFDVKKIVYPSNIENPCPNSVISICYPIDGLIDSNGVIYSADRTMLYYVPSIIENIHLLDDINTIGQGAFAYNTKIITTAIPASVTTIGDYAFYGCSNLTVVDIPSSVATIGDYAFADCSNIASVKLSNNVDAVIGICAFQNCIRITELTIPQNLWKIGDKAFNGCTGLLTLNYNAINCTLCGPMSFPSNVKCINFGNSVYKLPAYAFYNCSELTEVIIPKGVVNVGEKAFENCSGLIKAAYPSKIKNPFKCSLAISYPKNGIIDSNNVIYNVDMTEIYYVPYQIENIHLPDGLVAIKNESFAGCEKLTDVAIPNSVTTIESSAFLWCSSLMEICIPNSVSRIDYRTFVGCTNMKSITIGSQVNHIAYDAFRETNITKAFWLNETPISGGIGAKFNFVPNDSYELPNQTVLKYIGDKFKVNDYQYVPLSSTNNICMLVDYIDSQGDTNISIPNKVAYKEREYDIIGITNAAFYGLSTLETISIPRNVRTIDNNAFKGCSGLKNLYSYAEEPPTCGEQTFDDAAKWDCNLFVPKGSLNKYQSADQWKEFFSIEEFDHISDIDQILPDNENDIEVYNFSGVKVGEGMDGLAPGIYVVRSGGQTWKVRI